MPQRFLPSVVLSSLFIACSGPAAPDGGAAAMDASSSADAGGPGDAARDDGAASPDAGSIERDGGSTTPYATFTDACNAGPFPTDDLAPEGCGPENEPRCPTAPAAGGRPVAKVATCAYGRGATTCEPVVGGNCGTLEGTFFDFNLINPNPDAPIGCWGRAHLFLEPAADGSGFHVDWGAYATNNADCSDAGMAEGELDVPNACCEQIVDLHFPHGEFTFRMAVRIDWAPSP